MSSPTDSRNTFLTESETKENNKQTEDQTEPAENEPNGEEPVTGQEKSDDEDDDEEEREPRQYFRIQGDDDDVRPVSAVAPKVVFHDETQVEVSSTPAFQCIDEVWPFQNHLPFYFIFTFSFTSCINKAN